MVTSTKKYTFQDFLNGKCQAEQIGISVPDDFDEAVKDDFVVIDSVVDEIEDIPPMSNSQRRALIQRVHDQALLVISNDVSGMISDSASTVNKILDTAARLLERDTEATDPFILSIEQLEGGFSTPELKRSLLAELDSYELGLFMECYAAATSHRTTV